MGKWAATSDLDATVPGGLAGGMTVPKGMPASEVKAEELAPLTKLSAEIGAALAGAEGSSKTMPDAVRAFVQGEAPTDELAKAASEAFAGLAADAALDDYTWGLRMTKSASILSRAVADHLHPTFLRVRLAVEKKIAQIARVTPSSSATVVVDVGKARIDAKAVLAVFALSDALSDALIYALTLTGASRGAGDEYAKALASYEARAKHVAVTYFRYMTELHDALNGDNSAVVTAALKNAIGLRKEVLEVNGEMAGFAKGLGWDDKSFGTCVLEAIGATAFPIAWAATSFTTLAPEAAHHLGAETTDALQKSTDALVWLHVTAGLTVVSRIMGQGGHLMSMVAGAAMGAAIAEPRLASVPYANRVIRHFTFAQMALLACAMARDVAHNSTSSSIPVAFIRYAYNKLSSLVTPTWAQDWTSASAGVAETYVTHPFLAWGAADGAATSAAYMSGRYVVGSDDRSAATGLPLATVFGAKFAEVVGESAWTHSLGEFTALALVAVLSGAASLLRIVRTKGAVTRVSFSEAKSSLALVGGGVAALSLQGPITYAIHVGLFEKAGAAPKAIPWTMNPLRSASETLVGMLNRMALTASELAIGTAAAVEQASGGWAIAGPLRKSARAALDLAALAGSGLPCANPYTLRGPGNYTLIARTEMAPDGHDDPHAKSVVRPASWKGGYLAGCDLADGTVQALYPVHSTRGGIVLPPVSTKQTGIPFLLSSGQIGAQAMAAILTAAAVRGFAVARRRWCGRPTRNILRESATAAASTPFNATGGPAAGGNTAAAATVAPTPTSAPVTRGSDVPGGGAGSGVPLAPRGTSRRVAAADATAAATAATAAATAAAAHVPMTRGRSRSRSER